MTVCPAKAPASPFERRLKVKHGPLAIGSALIANCVEEAADGV